ncbi:hypothetical protein Agabi119p4_7566 [Agaricus bisporus var. burnettii]|uniref:NACHT domain-containing protein n=1 Tax=Agaricus bisporus var. burnettii TaxID=192524 RepID=A0A8H7C7Z7_AGABI|nr:hypothetical protein Agabi119p4_7566 [Agaricus bisporus var. burnettii]
MLLNLISSISGLFKPFSRCIHRFKDETRKSPEITVEPESKPTDGGAIHESQVPTLVVDSAPTGAHEAHEHLGAHETREDVGVHEAHEQGGAHEARGHEALASFNNASGFTLDNLVAFDIRSRRFIQNIHNHIISKTAVLHQLFSYTCPEAAVDSSARDPPPRCHPGTRQRIKARLLQWLHDPKRLLKMIWLYGAAGTGKSAISQTFSEAAGEEVRLGASYFFSRTQNRSSPDPLIPSLVYQLAVRFPDYGAIIANVIGHDLTIPQKSPRTQLRKLIIEPFTELLRQGHQAVDKPLLIVIDGLDECQDIDAQREIVEMIGEIVRLKPDLPLLWLIASRPEPHLRPIFSRADFSIDCSKEELEIDEETKEDIGRYLRDSFDDILIKSPYVTAPVWPSEKQIEETISVASGLFVLASTIIRYVRDSQAPGVDGTNPMIRLNKTLEFMQDTNRDDSRSPVTILDMLYSQIFADIPEDVLPKTMRILAHVTYADRFPFSDFSGRIQLLCNFLRMEQHEFYIAIHHLHSVMKIPLPEEASSNHFQMVPYHASFVDYLRDPVRSGRFAISLADARIMSARMYLFWHKARLDALGFSSDGMSNQHPDFLADEGLAEYITPRQLTSPKLVLPQLTWFSPEANEMIMQRCTKSIWTSYRYMLDIRSGMEDLLTEISHMVVKNRPLS